MFRWAGLHVMRVAKRTAGQAGESAQLIGCSGDGRVDVFDKIGRLACHLISIYAPASFYRPPYERLISALLLKLLSHFHPCAQSFIYVSSLQAERLLPLMPSVIFFLHPCATILYQSGPVDLWTDLSAITVALLHLLMHFPCLVCFYATLQF